jgi:hypothetical protein
MLLGINGSKVDTVWKPLCEIEVLKTRTAEKIMKSKNALEKTIS